MPEVLIAVYAIEFHVRRLGWIEDTFFHLNHHDKVSGNQLESLFAP